MRSLIKTHCMRHLIRLWKKDERVFLIGEDIGVYGGAFGVTGDLQEKYGKERVIDTPISEAAITGACVGAALTGMRPGGRDHDQRFCDSFNGAAGTASIAYPIYVWWKSNRTDGTAIAGRFRYRCVRSTFRQL